VLGLTDFEYTGHFDRSDFWPQFMTVS